MLSNSALRAYCNLRYPPLLTVPTFDTRNRRSRRARSLLDRLQIVFQRLILLVGADSIANGHLAGILAQNVPSQPIEAAALQVGAANDVQSDVGIVIEEVSNFSIDVFQGAVTDLNVRLGRELKVGLL